MKINSISVTLAPQSASSKHYSWLYLSIYPPISIYLPPSLCAAFKGKGHGFLSKEEGLGSNEQDPRKLTSKVRVGERIPWGPTGTGKKALQSQPGRWHVAKRPKPSTTLLI